MNRLQERAQKVAAKFSGTSAEHLVRKLGAMDVVNRAMLFAAVMLLCFFPFLIVVNALAGRSAAIGLTRHLGLSHEAANEVGGLFASSTSTSNAVTGTGYVFFVLGGIAAATAIQDLYEKAFGLESRGMRDILRRLGWLGVLIAGAALSGWAGPHVEQTGGVVLLGVLGAAVLMLFWWFTAWFLLGGRRSWHSLLPTAVATALFWVGMQLVFRIIFSRMVISNHKKYGEIGVVLALMSWFIAIGVVIVLGAVVGLVWRERNLSLSGAWRRIRLTNRRHR